MKIDIQTIEGPVGDGKTRTALEFAGKACTLMHKRVVYMTNEDRVTSLVARLAAMCTEQGVVMPSGRLLEFENGYKCARDLLSSTHETQRERPDVLIIDFNVAIPQNELVDFLLRSYTDGAPDDYALQVFVTSLVRAPSVISGMTYRELKEQLNTLTDEQLDEECTVLTDQLWVIEELMLADGSGKLQPGHPFFTADLRE